MFSSSIFDCTAHNEAYCDAKEWNPSESRFLATFSPLKKWRQGFGRYHTLIKIFSYKNVYVIIMLL